MLKKANELDNAEGQYSTFDDIDVANGQCFIDKVQPNRNNGIIGEDSFIPEKSDLNEKKINEVEIPSHKTNEGEENVFIPPDAKSILSSSETVKPRSTNFIIKPFVPQKRFALWSYTMSKKMNELDNAEGQCNTFDSIDVVNGQCIIDKVQPNDNNGGIGNDSFIPQGSDLKKNNGKLIRKDKNEDGEEVFKPPDTYSMSLSNETFIPKSRREEQLW